MSLYGNTSAHRLGLIYQEGTCTVLLDLPSVHYRFPARRIFPKSIKISFQMYEKRVATANFDVLQYGCPRNSSSPQIIGQANCSTFLNFCNQRIIKTFLYELLFKPSFHPLFLYRHEILPTPSVPQILSQLTVWHKLRKYDSIYLDLLFDQNYSWTGVNT